MRIVTIASLGASAGLGLLALLVAKTMMPNAAAAHAPPSAPRPVVGQPVVVAARPLKFGDRLDADHLTVIHLPADALPEGAFSTVDAVLALDGGGAPVALTPIALREPLLPSKLSGPGARPSVAAEIGAGLRAYTVKVSDVSGVGGHALPGDRVDVVLMRDLTPEGSTRAYVSEVVLQNVRVLAVDLNADLASNKPATPSTATLEVTVADTQKLAMASELGKLSLALRPTGSAETAQAPPVRTGVFSAGGGAPARVATRAASRRTASAPAAPGLITVVEGDTSGARAERRRTTTATVTLSAPLPTAKTADGASDFKPTIG